MRRLLNPVIRYIADWARAAVESWDNFWFTPADPTLLGMLRVLTGMMLLYTHAVWGLVLGDFFGPRSWLSEELIRTLQEGGYACSFWWLVPSGWMWPAYGVSMVILALFTVGLWTQVTSVLAFVVTISFAHRVPVALFGLDQINAMLTLYLAIGASGQAISADRRLAIRRGRIPSSAPSPSERANLAQRLINVHMCVIYFFAGISKLQGEAWWNGEAMWRAFSNLEYQSIDMTWLAWHPRMLDLMTHVSIFWEISCALIWRPRLRPIMLVGAVVLHVGIGACLGMWTFGLIMLVGCASFLPNDAVRRLVETLTSGRVQGHTPRESSRTEPTETDYLSSRNDVMEPVFAGGGLVEDFDSFARERS